MLVLKDGDFTGQRLLRDGDWAVCFGADWCGFCRAFKRSYEKLDGQTPFQVGWADVTDYESSIWKAFDLDVIPTLMAFRGGEVLWRKDGTGGVGLRPSEITALKEALK